MRPPTGPGARRRAAAAVLALAALAAAGCAAGLSGSGARDLVARGDYDAALKSLKPLDNGGSRLLFLCERGLILHDQGRYAESNEALEQAHTLLEDLYTRSLSREIGALLTTDLIIQYRGERFEAGLVHYYKIMNSLRLGKVEDAAVEARRLNHELQVFKDQGGSFYTDDPFLQYLTGLVYSLSGDATDADVSLRAALQAYDERAEKYGVAPPPGLPCDLAAAAQRLGSLEDARRYDGDGRCGSAGSGVPTGVIHLFLECGYAPAKVENAITLPIYKEDVKEKPEESALAKKLVTRRGAAVEETELSYLLRVAVPAIAPTPSPVATAEIRPVAAGDSLLPAAHAAVAQNLCALSVQSFEEHQAEILLRSATRAVAKYLAKQGAEKKEGKFAGWVVNLLGVATENADVRNWSTLPDRILVARLELPPGTYGLNVDFRDASGHPVGATRLDQVVVRAGQSQIVNVRVPR